MEQLFFLYFVSLYVLYYYRKFIHVMLAVLCRYNRGDCMMDAASKQQCDSQPTTRVDVKRPQV